MKGYQLSFVRFNRKQLEKFIDYYLLSFAAIASEDHGVELPTGLLEVVSDKVNIDWCAEQALREVE